MTRGGSTTPRRRHPAPAPVVVVVLRRGPGRRGERTARSVDEAGGAVRRVGDWDRRSPG
ncbi:hypothetical protein QJS66_12005 [Kocuria rhizophila]|nr:hypothetical protein QJS66_12005 [Kocuria rhizophila]